MSWGRRYYWQLATIFLLGMAVRFWLLMEPVNSDQMSYFISALGAERHPGFQPEIHHHSLRLVMVWLIRLSGLLFGYTLATYQFSVHLHAILSFVSLLALALVLFNLRTALVVTALWATSFAYLDVDTTLLPDNIGVSLALLGIAAVLQAGKTENSRPMLTPSLLAFAGGVLLWAACGARETFVIHLLATGLVLLLIPWRRGLFVPLLLGLGLGAVLELSWFQLTYGTPFARIEYFLGINSLLSSHYADWAALTPFEWLTRYPRMLHDSGSAELLLFVLGGLGALFWLVEWRRTASRASLVFLVLTFAFVAYSLLSLNPLRPYFELKMRYYVSCVPFVYLGCADLLLRLWDRTAGFQGALKIAPRLVMGAAFLWILSWNLAAASGRQGLMKNGYDAYDAVAVATDRDRSEHGRAAVIFADGDLGPILPLYFPERSGWEVVERGENAVLGDYDRAGYLALSWRRLNQSHKAEQAGRVLDDHPLLFRHRVELDFTDLYLVGPQKLRRDRQDVSGRLPGGWSREGNNPTAPPEALQVPGDRTPLRIDTNRRVFSGRGGSGEPPDSGAGLPGDHFLRFSFDGKGFARRAILKAFVYGWRTGQPQAEPTRLFLGRVFLVPERKNMVLSNYLPHAFDRFRLVLESRVAAVELENPVLELLSRHEDDVLRQAGGAW